MEAAISSGEKSYLVLGVEQGLRHDGRGVLDFRGFSIRGGVLPQCNGSARISVEGGKTTILAAVKVEVGEPKPSRPAEGWVETHVDCSSSLFARSDDPSRSGVAAKLGQLLQRTLGESGAVHTKELCIIPGKFCWIVHVDMLVLQSDGNLVDALSLAAWVALNTAVIPVVNLLADSSGKPHDFEISPGKEIGIPGAGKVPICISLCKVGQAFVADATAEEETCSDAKIVFGVNAKKQVCSVTKEGAGRIPTEQMVPLALTSVKLSSDLYGILEQLVDNGVGPTYTTFGMAASISTF